MTGCTTLFPEDDCNGPDWCDRDLVMSCYLSDEFYSTHDYVSKANKDGYRPQPYNPSLTLL
ncbi:MAG: hypothetical protein GY847_01220 [Proteobacteria bacterium]|nr:hypothetical protein [Pseudomonadota bacterium]